MAKIDNAYAYYISTYAQKTVSRYDSHKKSELRKVYNKIVKINKDSPLYKIPNLTDAKKYAIIKRILSSDCGDWHASIIQYPKSYTEKIAGGICSRVADSTKSACRALRSC